MSESLEAIKKIINDCSFEDRRALRRYLQILEPHDLEKEWGIDGDTVLSAIYKSSDLTKRGVRGIIAEAVFETDVLPNIEALGWRGESVKDLPYDVLLHKNDLSIKIQIKLQRLEKGQPKLYYPKHYVANTLYVVEVQKTRSGTTTTTEKLQGSETELKVDKSVTIQTRPYHYEDFDILAVNMHPSSGSWRDFRYTLGSWLLPRRKKGSPGEIEVFQPVAAITNEVWTDDLTTCLAWFETKVERRVLTDLLHLPKTKVAKSNKSRGGSKRSRKLV